ncbi:MAG: hypothetical protein IJE14_01870 [Clostridia bacterium]|nr:hypothetical protein [Clostridia bacterium]MBQ6932403.1 hypothetical protein [Clostridia bacterium]MBQ7101485.1 hypothetical protein [Clostridia bacterium]MBR2957940.1 hypothetical protein [Clostridia bacterium]MBR3753746.1 hypothetical protein [Clostridia bacterium]
MTLTEKAAYIKGLADGLNLDADKPETKIINALLDLVDDMALSVCDLEDELALVGEQVDAVDEDLDALESYVYDDDDCDCCCDDDCDCCDDDFFEVECPACGEIINVDEGILESGSIQCPNCNENLEFDIEYDEDEDEE